MFSYLYELIKKILNYPNLIEKRLNNIEHKLFIYFLILLHVEVIGFIIVYEFLESGFHWKYLFQL
jgi:uncharacterized membrane protein